MKNTTTISTSYSGGAGLGTLLTVLFVALKLLGYITWSWWWVFSPIWIPATIVVILLTFIFLAIGRK